MQDRWPPDPKDFDADAYLERIGHGSAISGTEVCLDQIHRAQAYTIPFENFDILLDRGIALAPSSIFDKLVRSRRGGYCFELNSLLLMAFQAFGFAVRPLLARVHLGGDPSGRGHMLLLVTLGDRDWLADAGFGGPGLRAPIPLERDRVTEQDGHRFRLVDGGVFGHMLQTFRDDDWMDLYSFDLGHVIAPDLIYGNHFTSTHPGSFFTFARVAALPRPDGRVALLNRSLIVESGESQREIELADDPGYLDALREYFGIELDAPYAALRPLQEY